MANTGAVTVDGGTFDLNSYTEMVGAVTVNSGYIVNGTLTGGAFTKTTSGTGTLTANLTVSSASIGSGTLWIGNSSGTGLTVTGGGSVTVDGGTLRVNNTGSSYGVGSAVTVNSGTLGGNGKINGAVTINSGGHLASGNSIGSLTSSMLTLMGNSVTDIQFADGATSWDRYVVTSAGGLTLNSGAKFSFKYDEGATLPGADFGLAGLYRLISYNGGYTGNLGSLTVDNPVINRTYNFVSTADNYLAIQIGGTAKTWNGSSGSGGNDLWSTSGNWGGSAPTPGDILVFDGTERRNNYNDYTNYTVFDGIQFNSSAVAFTLNENSTGSNRIELQGNIVNQSTQTQTINIGLRLNGITPTVNAASGDIILAGNISETGGSVGLVKTGSKVLELTGNNTYSGATEIQSGIVRVANLTTALSPNSNLKFNGGILEGAGSFTRSLGSGGGSVQWIGSGGFSALGGSLTVNIAGAGGTLTWGSGGFVTDGGTLKFSATSADNTVYFRNRINLSSGMDRVIDVGSGIAGIDVELSGTISGNANLVKVGAGTMLLSANNNYTGATTVNDGALLVSGTLASGSVIVNSGATLGGNGTFSGTLNLNSGGVLDAGALDRVGSMTVGSLAWNDGGTLHWDLTDPTLAAGTGWDFLSIVGTLSLANTGSLNVLVDTTSLLGTLHDGSTFTVATASGGIPGFSDGTLNQIHFTSPGGYNFTASKVLNDLVFTYTSQSIAAVPEPNVLLLWISGLATLYPLRKRLGRKVKAALGQTTK